MIFPGLSLAATLHGVASLLDQPPKSAGRPLFHGRSKEPLDLLLELNKRICDIGYKRLESRVHAPNHNERLNKDEPVNGSSIW